MTQTFTGKPERIDDFRWRIPEAYSPGMRVPGIVYSDEKMLEGILKDNALQQVANAAHLPGIVKAAMAMPDIHWGYGLPIGGVVATDIEAGGVVTPGGVGYDINCGVRLLRTSLEKRDAASRIEQLVDALYAAVPAGVGSRGAIRPGKKETDRILTRGAGWAVEQGYGWASDLEFCEEGGAIEGADPDRISPRTRQRGKDQPGTLGSGNHFLEVQVVDRVFDSKAAAVFGIFQGQLTVMIHTGSRGLGHQICGEYASLMVKTCAKYGISVPDRQLACAPVRSPEGENYIGAMKCAANYAWCNRQIITHFVRNCFERVMGRSAGDMGMALVYDVAHNIAKFEKHVIGGREKTLCVHRKGATRAFPRGHGEIPAKYAATGQPVIIPGDMGRCSYLLAGTEGAAETFYSTCHGAGRLLSRSAAKKNTRNRHIARELAGQGIIVKHRGRDTLHEEAPEAYKDVSRVVDIVEGAGISRKIARMRPLGVVKG